MTEGVTSGRTQGSKGCGAGLLRGTHPAVHRLEADRLHRMELAVGTQSFMAVRGNARPCRSRHRVGDEVGSAAGAEGPGGLGHFSTVKSHTDRRPLFYAKPRIKNFGIIDAI